MGNKEGNLYCQAIFLNFEGGMGTGWFRVKDGKKKTVRISHLLKQFLTQFLKFRLKLQ